MEWMSQRPTLFVALEFFPQPTSKPCKRVFAKYSTLGLVSAAPEKIAMLWGCTHKHVALPHVVRAWAILSANALHHNVANSRLLGYLCPSTPRDSADESIFRFVLLCSHVYVFQAPSLHLRRDVKDCIDVLSPPSLVQLIYKPQRMESAFFLFFLVSQHSPHI